MVQEVEFNWEIKIGQNVFYMSPSEYEKVLVSMARGKKLFITKDKTLNFAYMEYARKVFKNQDSSTAGNVPEWVKNFPKKADTPHFEVKKMDNSSYTIDELDAIFEKLKPKAEALNFPSLEGQGWEKNESVTAHDEGKENHKVEAFKKKLKINGDIPEKYFSLEASYVFCPTCKKYLKKRIYLLHHRGSEAYFKDY